ncbi:hypothetical protein [Aureivirga sp. CE67]|uniref:hypothetical protein n=1 Tax=Aureivirga sp. CE67 TaxID=1788983 RepID=UPI0018C99B64|nr:hypothetical protein [Aureivirga sp. CE67]
MNIIKKDTIIFCLFILLLSCQNSIEIPIERVVFSNNESLDFIAGTIATDSYYITGPKPKLNTSLVGFNKDTLQVFNSENEYLKRMNSIKRVIKDELRINDNHPFNKGKIDIGDLYFKNKNIKGVTFICSDSLNNKRVYLIQLSNSNRKAFKIDLIAGKFSKKDTITKVDAFKINDSIIEITKKVSKDSFSFKTIDTLRITTPKLH